jgi:4-hydroxy-tetrahydrodipicolinate synthase
VFGEVLTAIVTPFDKNRRVDLDRFRELAEFLVDNGSDGLVVCGTTGEAPTLSDDEKLALWETAVDLLRGRATVIAGTGTYDTAHSIHLSQRAAEIGVDGLLVVTPYYSKPPQRAIVEHFKAIAAATDRPIVVYNIPQRVVVNIEPDTLTELAEIPNVQYVKQATPDIDQAKRIVNESGLTLFAGNDDLLLPFLEVGGKGGIFVFTHLVGRRVRERVTRYRDGDAAGAREIEAELRPVIDALAIDSNPIPVKAAMAIAGHDVGIPRLPLVDATDAQKAELRAVLERAGVLQAAQV